MSFTILFSIQDEKGKTSTTEVNLPTTVTFDNATLMAQQVALLINDLIRGSITRIGLVYNVVSPVGLRAAALADSDVEEGGRFQFRTDGGFFTGLRLPTLNEDVVISGTANLDLTDTDVAAFVAAMTAGIDLTAAGGTGTVQPSDKRDEDIVALEFAREQFQSSRG